MTFKIGIEVERTSTSLLIVECEAATLEDAKCVALRSAMERARKARSMRDLYPNTSSLMDVDWMDESFGANCVSDEIPQDQMEHYSPDLTVTA